MKLAQLVGHVVQSHLRLSCHSMFSSIIAAYVNFLTRKNTTNHLLPKQNPMSITSHVPTILSKHLSKINLVTDNDTSNLFKNNESIITKTLTLMTTIIRFFLDFYQKNNELNFKRNNENPDYPALFKK